MRVTWGHLRILFTMRNHREWESYLRTRENGFLTQAKELAIYLHNQNPFLFNPSLRVLSTIIIYGK